MTSFQAIILGIIQGITEFLPISSSAHLILTSKILNWPDQGAFFDISVHFGSLIAVIIYFRAYMKVFVKGFFDLLRKRKTTDSELVKKLILATIPVVVIGFMLRDFVENYTRETILIIGITSIFWSILLFFADKKESKITEVDKISYKAAFMIGLTQSLAIIPGTSRSGSTITIARFLKISRKISAEFSMLMSIPVIFIVGIVSLVEQKNIILQSELIPLFLGTLTSFVFALCAIHYLLKLLEKTSFLPFIIYRIILGVVIFYIIM